MEKSPKSIAKPQKSLYNTKCEINKFLTFILFYKIIIIGGT